MLTVTNLNFGYRLKKPLFTGLSLQLAGGTICGLLGKNGAGKTTLLRLFSGLRYPVSGTITFGDFQPRHRSPAFLRDLYLLPEEFELPAVKASWLKASTASFYPDFSDEQFSACMESFDLDAGLNLQKYSHGQRKKFLIALGIASNAKLLLLDEPTNGLDIPSKAVFRKLAAAGLTGEGLTIISTHQVKDIETLIDDIVIIDRGAIVFHESLDRVSEKLLFEHQASPPDPEEVIYSEKSLQGHLVIKENSSGTPSSVALEPLFNTVINNRTRVSALFNNTGGPA